MPVRNVESQKYNVHRIYKRSNFLRERSRVKNDSDAIAYPKRGS